MTVHNDLERAIAMAEAAKGSYMLFSTESEDVEATKVFKEMAEDMHRHVTILESRLDYVNEHNKLNAGEDGRKGQDEQDENQKQSEQKTDDPQKKKAKDN